MTIRPATPADQPQIQAILAASPEAANWADTYPLLVADQENSDHNRITAFLLYRPIQFAQATEECEILNLAVHPSHRRQGQARALLTHLLQSLPATTFHLEVRASNLPALALYQSLGFHLSGQRPNYYANGETALLLTRPSK